jgi:outer membrane protein assembly factor BamB
MQRVGTALILSLLAGCVLAADAPDAWPHRRGPEFNGVARGDAPLAWSDKDHIAWKVQVPGKGHSSPVIWGHRRHLSSGSEYAVLDTVIEETL